MMDAVEQRPEAVSLSMACKVLGLNRSTIYARSKAHTVNNNGRCRRNAPQPRALSQQQRDRVMMTLNSTEYQDQPPREVYYDLLDKGTYLCSVSTMYRLLSESDQVGERRNQREAKHHAVPRLEATKPLEVLTWDITKLPTIEVGVYLSLYVVLDLFSRYVVSWLVSSKENAELATFLMGETFKRYDIKPGQTTIHQDRGTPMTANKYLDKLISQLGATCSHSRPRVSNDNPMSESQFRTLKYQPDYPERFDSVKHAQRWSDGYFRWYNHEHHHVNLAGFTPSRVFTGEYKQVAIQRQSALDRQYLAHPNRFVRGRPKVKMPPSVVRINPVTEVLEDKDADSTVNFPTLTAAKQLEEVKYTLIQN